MTTLEHMGISDPLLVNEAVLNDLGKSLIGSAITIVDDDIRIKEEQRDATIKLGYDTITNEMILTDMDAATRRAVMVLQISANDYMMLVENYVVTVLNLITDAKEYAFEVGKNAIDLAQIKAEIAEEKGAIYVQKVDLQIQLEAIERKHVELELLRAELAVAKAHTALLMAEIDVARADLALVEVNVKVAMAELEKIQIEVDIAMTIADIVTRGLAAIKLDVETAEIAAAFGIIASKLDAILSIIAEKSVQLNEQTGSKVAILGDIKALTSANVESQGKRVDEASSNAAVQEHAADKTADALSQELAQLSTLIEAQLSEITARTMALGQTEAAQTAASALLDAARIIARAKFRKTVTFAHLGQDVHPNSSIVC